MIARVYSPSGSSPEPGRGRRRRGAPVTLVAVLAVLAGAFPIPAGGSKLTDRIVAVVNKEVIMLSEFQKEMEPDRKRLKQQYHGAELRTRLHQAEYWTLTRLIERRIQMQHAATKGIDATEEDIRRTAMEMRQQGTPVNLDDPAEKKRLREQLILLALENREVRTGVMVSEDELKVFYERHLTLFMLPEEYRISQILLSEGKYPSRENLRARAREVHDQLKKGDEFNDLALRYSDDAQATRGGNLGFVRRGELNPAIERVVAALEPGRISEPVETAEGIHIIRLDEKKTVQFRPLEEVKNEMKELVFQQKSADRYQQWLTDLKSKAYIEVKL